MQKRFLPPSGVTSSLLAVWLAWAMPGAAQRGAAPRDECRFEAVYTAAANALDAQSLDIRAGAGDLVVVGVPSHREATVRGRACASKAEQLKEISLGAQRDGAKVRVEALVPDVPWSAGDYALLDLVVEVPANIATSITDSGGSIETRGVGNLSVDDSAGSIIVEDVTGWVRIDDTSGAINVVRVNGDVHIDDAAGSIDLRDISGSVDVSDSSGALGVRGVTGDLIVRSKASGDVVAEDVGGDLLVERGASDGGDVEYRNVGGRVSVPKDD